MARWPRYGVRVTDPWTMRRVRIVERAADRAAEVFSLVADWLLSEPMAELLEAFGKRLPAPGFARDHNGGPVNGWINEKLPDWLLRAAVDPAAAVDGLSPPQVDTLRRILAVERMTSPDFNFRGTGQYRERRQASSADFTPEFRTRIRELATQLGLVRAQEPGVSEYDKTLILGGGYLSPLLRARYAALLRSEGFQLGEVTFLGSPRFLIEKGEPERPITGAYAPGARDEFDLLVAAAQAEFGLTLARTTFLCGCSSADVWCPHWAAREAEGAEETPAAYTHERRAELVDDAGRTVASLLSASTGRPPNRPDTSDTFSLWARCANPQVGQRVLMVTSQLFVPFQSFDGMRLLYLPHGVDLDVVGYGDDWEDRQQPAEHLLQETLSAVRSGRRLLVDAAGVLMGAAAGT
jgi:hypothetical protein